MFEDKTIKDYFPTISVKMIVSAILFICGCICAAIGCYFIFDLTNNRPEDCLTHSVKEPQENVATLYVDVSGAIKKPGLYQLAINSRVADAISLAGGFTDRANKKFLARDLNVATSLSDGMKLYIPFEGEQINEKEKTVNSSKISINNALQKELETLEGIGEKRAEDIINNRPFTKLEELTEKEILTVTMLNKIINDIEL